MSAIKKTYTTETAHIVRGAVSERCKFNVHGHSYLWEVEITSNDGQTNEAGMVLDFIELKPIKEFIDQFDHAMILWSKEEKEFMNFFHNNCKRVIVMRKNTTAENMARLVFKFTRDWLKEKAPNCSVTAVNVWETKTGCGIAHLCDDDDVIEC